MVLQPPEPDSIGDSGVRKASPIASPENTQQFLDDACNVRAKQNRFSSAYNLIYVDHCKEDTQRREHKNASAAASSNGKTLPRMIIEDEVLTRGML